MNTVFFRGEDDEPENSDMYCHYRDVRSISGVCSCLAWLSVSIDSTQSDGIYYGIADFSGIPPHIFCGLVFETMER
jgi:hypothetical protein